MTQRVDGRDARWAQHRARRRRELVQSTLRAIRKHGPGVGMDEIAAEARTSKTVVYRHFGGRTGLYLAVVEAVDEVILEDLQAAMSGTDPEDLLGLVRDMVGSYLSLVARDPQIYRFVVSRPLLDRPVREDPVAGLTDRIGDQVAQALAAHLRRTGQDDSCAPTWGHGLVGFVRAAADHWLGSGMPTDHTEVARHVTALFGPAFAATVPTPGAPTPTRT